MSELPSTKEINGKPEMTAEGKIWWEHDVQTVNQLAQGFFHQVRNKMTPIAGLAGFMEKRSKDERTRRDGGVIIEKFGQIKEYFSRVLELQMCCLTKTYSFKELTVAKLIQMSAEILDRDNVSVVVSGDATVLADSGHFSKAIEELLQNSAEAGAKNVGVEIRVDQGKVELTVTDDGEGIALKPDEIFGLSSSTKTDERGFSKVYSYGLFMAKTIMLKHGATFFVVAKRDADEPGQKGTKVIITLPAA